jgi:hypothetical protein
MPDSGSNLGEAIGDDEIVYRRVPRNPPFHTPSEWLSTANFSLDSRRNELGVSVYRKRYRSARDILSDPSAIPGSFVVGAAVGDIRRLTDGLGNPLLLNVVPDDEHGANPGHAEIRSQTLGRLTRGARKALRDLFAMSSIEE